MIELQKLKIVGVAYLPKVVKGVSDANEKFFWITEKFWIKERSRIFGCERECQMLVRNKHFLCIKCRGLLYRVDHSESPMKNLCYVFWSIFWGLHKKSYNFEKNPRYGPIFGKKWRKWLFFGQNKWYFRKYKLYFNSVALGWKFYQNATLQPLNGLCSFNIKRVIADRISRKTLLAIRTAVGLTSCASHQSNWTYSHIGKLTCNYSSNTATRKLQADTC